MITKNFEDYPEHRLKFFSLLRAIATHCFPALFHLSSQVGSKYYYVPAGWCWCINIDQLIQRHFRFYLSSFFHVALCIFCTLQQLKLVMDSIIWAFRHTERNIAETGLNLLLEMLKNFQVW